MDKNRKQFSLDFEQRQKSRIKDRDRKYLCLYHIELINLYSLKRYLLNKLRTLHYLDNAFLIGYFLSHLPLGVWGQAAPNKYSTKLV